MPSIIIEIIGTYSWYTLWFVLKIIYRGKMKESKSFFLVVAAVLVLIELYRFDYN